MSSTTSLNLTGVDRRPGLGRLTGVELRKMVDTRAGFWVPIGVSLATLLVALIVTLNHGAQDATLTHVFHATVQPGAFLLPVMGVLLICGEWSQRTTLTTFTLVPERRRVIAAKVLAGLVVSVVALVVSILFTLLAVGLFGKAPGGAGSLPLTVIGQGAVYVGSAMVMGLAFGAAILMSAPAIVAYLLLPTIWDAVVGGIHSLNGVARWLDSSQSLDPLALHPLSGTEWAHALVTMAVWIGIPIAVGWARIGRGDIS
jgi:ABC-type transport system involved in multi-copper enzyme maturation permease subunit